MSVPPERARAWLAQVTAGYAAAEIIDSVAKVLAAGPRLRLAMLFGSFATGHATLNSDVDIAIIPVDAGLTLHAELELAAAIEAATGKRTDVVRLDQASFALRWEIARTGLAVTGDHAEVVRFRATTASEHADVGPSLVWAAETYRRALVRGA